MVDDSALAERQLELLLYGEIFNKIPIHLFTDSESTLESVAFCKQILTKTLRNVIVNLKERLTKDEITSYAWLLMDKMLADVLTKEKKLPPKIDNIFSRNDLDLVDIAVNKVMEFGQEVQMINIRN